MGDDSVELKIMKSKMYLVVKLLSAEAMDSFNEALRDFFSVCVEEAWNPSPDCMCEI